MFEQGALTLFRVRGVPIRAHWTLLLILPYLAVMLSVQFRSVASLAGVTREQLLLPPLVWGVVLALGLFASVTLHELAHTAAALRFGGSVRSITLMLLGGVSQLARLPERPGQEAIMAAVGPLTSLVLGGLLLLAYAATGEAPADLRMGLFYLAAANLTLGVFNLVPAFPMDGGRLLRAALALRLDRERATRIAARIGKVCALGLGLVGLWSMNLLLLLIAMFVYSGAHGEVTRERIRGALEGLRIVDLLPMLRRPPPLIASTELLTAVLPRMRELDRLALVVVDARGEPVSVIQAGDLAAVPASARGTVTVGELTSMLPVRHVVVPWEVSANDAIQRTVEAGAELVIVVDPRSAPPHDLVGLVAADDIARMVQLQLLATPSARPPRSRPAPLAS